MHESAEAVLGGLIACIAVLGIAYWTYFTPDNKTLTPDMVGVESLAVFGNLNLEFNDANNTKPDSKSVGIMMATMIISWLKQRGTVITQSRLFL